MTEGVDAYSRLAGRDVLACLSLNYGSRPSVRVFKDCEASTTEDFPEPAYPQAPVLKVKPVDYGKAMESLDLAYDHAESVDQKQEVHYHRARVRK